LFGKSGFSDSDQFSAEGGLSTRLIVPFSPLISNFACPSSVKAETSDRSPIELVNHGSLGKLNDGFSIHCF